MGLYGAVLSIISVLKIPSMILYIMVWVVLIRYRKELNSHFFNICISLGVADFFYTVINIINFVLMEYSGIQEWSPSLRMAYTFINICAEYGSYLAQLGGVLVLTVNRFTAITLSNEYQQIWSGAATLALAVCAQWAASVVFIGGMLAYPGPVLVERNLSWLVGFWYTAETSAIASTYMVACDVSVGVAIFAMYVCMIGKVVQRRKALAARQHAQSAGERLRAKSESKEMMLKMRLAVCGMVLSLCIAFYIVWDVVFFVGSFSVIPKDVQAYIADTFYSNMEDVGVIVDFVFVFSNPFLLLVCSTKVMKCFQKFIGVGGLVG